MLEKISAAQVDNIMIKAASALRGLKAENDRLRAQLAERDRRDHATKIASSAVDRGIMEEDEAKDYANDLANSGEDLRVVEDFVNRAAAGVPLGQTHEKVASAGEGEGQPGDGAEARFNDFLLSSPFAG
jgi:hypothetical protein